MWRFFLWCAVVCFPVAAIAQTASDIVRVCTPLVLNAAVSSVEKKESSELFRHYVTRVYSKRSQSIDEVRKQGFELGIVVEGVPISALWSDDRNLKKRAEDIFSKFVDDTLLVKDVKESKEYQSNAFALAEYNKCVSTMYSQGSPPLICYFSPTHDYDSATLVVMFKPGFEPGTTKVRLADIVNGFTLPAADVIAKLPKARQTAIETLLEKLDRRETVTTLPREAVRKLAIPKNTLGLGVHRFSVYRLNPDRPTSVRVNYLNGLSCESVVDPVARSEIKVEIWPTGKNWAPAQETYEYAETSGCSRNPSTRVREFCLSGPGHVVSVAPPNTWSANCGSHFDQVKIKPGDNRCVIATGVVHGCGKRHGECKGRGWLKTRLTVTKDVPSSPNDGARSQELRHLTEASWSQLFQYSGALPPEYRIDAWKFSVQITRHTNLGIQKLVMTEQSPTDGDCIATQAPATDPSGRVLVRCGVFKLVPVANQ